MQTHVLPCLSGMIPRRFFVVFVFFIAALDPASLARQNRRKPTEPLEIYSELPHSALRDLYALGSKGGCLPGRAAWSLLFRQHSSTFVNARQQSLVATKKLD
jgi:hypothetical protein